MKKVFQTIDNGIGYFESIVSIVSLLAICVIAFWQVVLRYVAGKSLPWSEEVIAALMVVMALTGAARGIRVKAHTEIEGVANVLPRQASIVLRLITSLITLAFLILVTASSFILFERAGVGGLKTPYLRIPYSYIYSSMVVGGALMVYEFVKIMKKRILGTYVPPDANEEVSLL